MDKAAIRIVPFESKYTKQIRDLIGSVLVYTGVINESDLPIDDTNLAQIPTEYSGKGGFWVVLHNDEIVGTVAIKDMGENIAKLRRMFVLPAYHGSGIGQVLLKFAVAHAQKQGFTKMILYSHKKMERAHHFYEKHGFIRKGEQNAKYFYELEL